MDGSLSVWKVVREAAANAVRYFSPLRSAWLLIVVGAWLLAWDIALRLSR